MLYTSLIDAGLQDMIAFLWFNHHRLLEHIGYIPLAEAEAYYYRQLERQAVMAV